MNEKLFQLVMSFITTADEVVLTKGYDIALKYVISESITWFVANICFTLIFTSILRKGLGFISYHRLIKTGIEDYDNRFDKDYYDNEYLWIGLMIATVSSLLILMIFIPQIFHNLTILISPEWSAINKIVRVVK
jgi:hypothetical protein